MPLKANGYAKIAGFQLSQADGYAVCNLSRRNRLDGASRNNMLDLCRALYTLQTELEQETCETIHDNGIGFAKFQAPALTIFAQTGSGETEDIRKKIGYHWAQIMTLFGLWEVEIWVAFNDGLLKCRKYNGKGTDLSVGHKPQLERMPLMLR